MKRAFLVVLVGLAMMFTAACGSAGHTVVSRTPPASSASSPSPPGHASACEDTSKPGNAMVMVDWVDFVQLHGVQFIAGLDGQVPAVSAAELGPVVGRVQCQLSALSFHQTPGPSVDGDAAFLSIGTELHAITGFEPSCRVAARIQGAYRVYLAHHDVGGVSKAVACAMSP